MFLIRGIILDEEPICYDELGCFSNGYPWTSVLRPFPTPHHPKQINTRFYLYTRKNPNQRYTVTLWDDISIEGSNFDPDRAYTTFITHGFASNGNASWVQELKDVYLQNRNANVFVVDWGKGASVWNYLQVASNTRIVGAEIARFLMYLIQENGLNSLRLHLIGHSLGAHISAYAAKTINLKIGQITGLDPAQPGFEGTPEEVRISKNDASLVDIIHTHGKPFIPFLGFGMFSPAGHIDYYMNGGLIQPGCYVLPEVKITNIADLAKYPVEVVSNWVSCSHSRAYMYYIEAISNTDCTFWGKVEGIVGTAVGAGTFGMSDKVIGKILSCNLERCSPIGLDTILYPARGIFQVITRFSGPFCLNDPEITRNMRQQRGLELNETIASTQKNEAFLKNVFDGIIG
ncbi:hypothetical protein PGB90_003455 [Kerria lacca]